MGDRSTYDALVEQLRTDVGQLVEHLENLVGPGQETWQVRSQVEHRAQLWASILTSNNDREAAQTVIDLMNALWPHADPPNDWWTTPLGHAVARSVGHPSAETISYSVAAAMLGCSKQYVAKLVRAGRLDRGPAGGVTSQSVRAALDARHNADL